MRKAGWLKNGTATERGIVDKNGKLLKSRRMTQEEIDAFNGKPKAAPKPKPVVEEPAPVVEVKEVEAEFEEVPEPRKTLRKKKPLFEIK